jgi:hypothetical protein
VKKFFVSESAEIFTVDTIDQEHKKQIRTFVVSCQLLFLKN